MIIKDKLHIIYSQLDLLLPQFKNICVKHFGLLPSQINKIVIGEDKVSMFFTKTLQEVTEDDLSGATIIPGRAFEKCKNLTTVTIPDSVTNIDIGAFYDCSNLINITIPNSVTNIGTYAFESCTSLKNITIPNSVTSIEYGAFLRCNNLESITIPNSVTSIGDYVFGYCTSLESMTISEGVKSIGEYTFESCTSLESITIPEGVTSIERYAFIRCNNLDNVYMYSITPPTLGNTSAIPNHTTIHVPVGSGEAYRNATNWSYHSDRIVEDIEL